MFTSDLIKLALQEDIGEGDVTSFAVIPDNLRARGAVLAKQDLIVAGLGVAGAVFTSLDSAARVEQLITDGSRVSSGTIVMQVEGNCRSLLMAERVALNFLQRLCGIATMTREFVNRTAGTHAKILDTRKTTPLMRHLEKYAVRMGGGSNHRFGLYDAILIKDNHIAASGTITSAVSAAKEKYPNLRVIVEATTVEQSQEAQAARADRILLDNMDDKNIRACLAGLGKGTEVEVSGGVTLDRIEGLAKMGVHYISVGALTHSATAANLSLEITSGQK